MTIYAIVAIIIAACSAILGAFVGHPFSKAAGKSEGVDQANQAQANQQAQATVQAVQERSDVEVKVAAATDADLDSKLSEFDRKS